MTDIQKDYTAPVPVQIREGYAAPAPTAAPYGPIQTPATPRSGVPKPPRLGAQR